MFSASVTMIDMFAKYWNEVEDAYGNIMVQEPALLEAITGEFKGTKKTVIGSALHAIMEKPLKYYNHDKKRYIYDGIYFLPELIKSIQADTIYGGASEVACEKTYDLRFDSILVRGRVDKLIWIEILDYKSTWSPINVELFINSFQGKFYMDAFGLDVMKYYIYQLAEIKDDETMTVITLLDKCKYAVDRYPDMQDDLISILNDFVEYIKIRGLESYFQPKHQTAIF